MYSSRSRMVYGFHGMDQEVGMKILKKEDNFRPSDNDYDWLGPGIYFWEDNLERAWNHANESYRPSLASKTPFVLGTILELGKCLDLLDQEWIDYLGDAYQGFKRDTEKSGGKLPQNSPSGARRLDCAVIEYACAMADEQGAPFDSVRAVFPEGEPLYETSGLQIKSHIQIAIINPDCIKGIFLPREREDQAA